MIDDRTHHDAEDHQADGFSWFVLEQKGDGPGDPEDEPEERDDQNGAAALVDHRERGQENTEECAEEAQVRIKGAIYFEDRNKNEDP